MTFNVTEWEYSNEKEVDTSRPQVEVGERTLYIKNAYMSKDKYDCDVYDIEFEDMLNHAEFTIRNWMYTTDKHTNNIIPNQGCRNTLIGMGKALAGPGSHVGILNPADIIGGVIIGIVKLNKSGYPVIYEYRPVPDDIAILSELEDQYYIGKEFRAEAENEDIAE